MAGIWKPISDVMAPRIFQPLLSAPFSPLQSQLTDTGDYVTGIEQGKNGQIKLATVVEMRTLPL